MVSLKIWSWIRSEADIASTSAAQSRVEPTTSENKNVTVPVGVCPGSTGTTSTYATRIRAAVKRFQDELKPAVDDSSAVRLHRLDEKLARLRNQQRFNQT